MTNNPVISLSSNVTNLRTISDLTRLYLKKYFYNCFGKNDLTVKH